MLRLPTTVGLALFPLSVSVLALAVLAGAAAAQAPDQESSAYTLRVSPEVRVVQRAGPAVVYIETDVVVERGIDIFGRRVVGRGVSKGSGVVLFADGYVVTNAHVVAGTRKARVRFDPRFDDKTYDAEVLSVVTPEDLALLKIVADGPFPTAEMGVSSDLMPGERVIAIGNPLGRSQTVSAGIISGLHREVTLQTETGTPLRFQNLIQTDASINPGNSGGPLLNINGDLIGINTAMERSAENIGFAIPVDRVKQVLEEALLSPSRARAWLGGDFQLGSLEFAELVPGGPAALAGIANGDRLVAINGRDIATDEDFRLLRVGLEAGRGAKLKLRASGGKSEPREVVVEPWTQVDALLYTRMGIKTESILLGRMRASTKPRLRVTAVRPGGPAGRLGLQVGDILDGLRVGCQLEYLPGDSVKIASDAITLALLIHDKARGCRIDLDVLRDENADGGFERGGERPEIFRGTLELD